MSIDTVRVSNVSMKATEHDIQDFFSFSGEIDHIKLHRDGEHSQVAYVTFKEAQALDTALLLSGATVVDQAVIIAPIEESEGTANGTTLVTEEPSNAVPVAGNSSSISGVTGASAQDVISNMLSRGFVLGKDAMSKAKAFDEKHQLIAGASARVSSFDKKIGISQKLSAGTSVVNQHVKAVDQKFQVSEKTRSAFAVAEQKVNNAGSALMKNRYVLTGATWVTGAFAKVTKTAGEVSQKAKEKAFGSDEQRRAQAMGSDGQEYHSAFTDSYTPPPTHPAERAAVSMSSAAASTSGRYPTGSLGYDKYSPVQPANEPAAKPPPAQGLIL